MRERGSAAAANAPLGSTAITWAWPKPESNGGATSTRWPRAASPSVPRRRGVTLDGDRRRSAAGPRVEPRPRPAQRPARRSDGGGGRLGVDEHPRRQLEQDLRLGVAAHRAEHGGQLTVASRHGRTQRVRRSPARPQLGRVALVEVEPEPAVVEVDARRRLDEPRPEAGGVGLDQADRCPAGVGRAEVRRVARHGGDRPVAGVLDVDEGTAGRRWRRAGRRRRPSRATRRAGRSEAVEAASTRTCAQLASSGSSGRPARSASRAAPSSR